MRIFTEGRSDNADGVALMYELSDENLEIVKMRSDYYLDRLLVKKLMADKGSNAHFFLLVKNVKGKSFRKYVEELRKEYKTVSWWTVLHRRFFILEGINERTQSLL